MAIIGNTFTTYDAKGLREDLSDVIYNISPTETPFISNASRETARSTLHEWQTETLANVDASNADVQGDDYTTFPAVDPTVRVGNYTQISSKRFLISGTEEAVDKAGRNSEVAHQLMKKGKELKRDMEAISLANQGGRAGTASQAPLTASMGAWLKSNVSLGTGSAANPTYTSGVPAAARTDGTQRAFTEAILKEVAKDCWTSGGSMDRMILVGGVNKQRFSGFDGISTYAVNTNDDNRDQALIVGAADVYVSDFGVYTVVADQFQRERDAWFVAPEYLSIFHLRPFRELKLAKTGDAEKRAILVEWGLQVKQEAAHGLAADLTTE